MTVEPNEQRFVQRMRELLVSLPYDMKVLFEAISDENLPLEARLVAAQATIYCLSPSDPIPDSLGLLGFVDDTLLVRLTLARILEVGGEDADEYPRRFPELFEPLGEDLKLARGFLGEDLEWLERRIGAKYSKAPYKGKDANEYLSDDEAQEYLYSEGLAFTTDYEIDEEEAAKLRNATSIKEAFHKRALVESRRS